MVWAPFTSVVLLVTCNFVLWEENEMNCVKLAWAFKAIKWWMDDISYTLFYCFDHWKWTFTPSHTHTHSLTCIEDHLALQTQTHSHTGSNLRFSILPRTLQKADCSSQGSNHRPSDKWMTHSASSATSAPVTWHIHYIIIHPSFVSKM